MGPILPNLKKQLKQSEWLSQWSLLEDNTLFLFEDWIKPFSLADFKDKTILECGCGGGQHTNFMASVASFVTAVDLNTTTLAKQKNKKNKNVTFLEADIANMQLPEQFDIVISIGVIHHTTHPEKTVKNLIKHLKPGGTLILWVYSQEGNALIQWLVEPIRKIFLKKLSRRLLLTISQGITALLYVPIYSIYLLPLANLPYYEYFQNFRKLSFTRNVLNVFDKLNAPFTDFISLARAKQFINTLSNQNITAYKAVSWRISAQK